MLFTPNRVLCSH